MKGAKYIVLDCETGGLNCEEVPITQIGLLILDDELKEINRWETYVKPYNDLRIEDDALKATGLKMSDIRAGITKQELLDQLMKIFKSCNTNKPGKWYELGNPILIGHNIGFDIGFLDYLFRDGKQVLNKFVSKNHIDTMALTKMVMPDRSSFNLTSCCADFGIELKDAHKAMADVIATASLFKKITKRLRGAGTSSEPEEEDNKQKSRSKFQF